MINFQKRVQDSQLKCTIDYRINRQFQVVSKSREIRQTQSQCQNKVAINNNNYIKPKRSIQYNSIQTDSTAFESLETDQRRQSTEPRNYQKRRSRIISTFLRKYKAKQTYFNHVIWIIQSLNKFLLEIFKFNSNNILNHQKIVLLIKKIIKDVELSYLHQKSISYNLKKMKEKQVDLMQLNLESLL
ncbi:unnamed protein product [Paramecium primaurelia]|uniref:Uncharacterized protein n=1 Tax=Paramecium primaurelia TaxID=5886 RepID=A0A8S1Q4T9_PARPR|nr:unnamed protein product [Paramecium primaurelia]